MSDLFIIFTRVDRLTKSYFSRFQEGCGEQSAKGIFFGTFEDDIHHVGDTNYDLILIPEDYYDLVRVFRLRQIIEAKERVFLTLHEGSDQKKRHEVFIRDIAGDKLQHPIRVEAHSKGGAVFALLQELSRGFTLKQKYNRIISQFRKHFDFDIVREVRIRFLLDCTQKNRIEYYLQCIENGEPITLVDYNFMVESSIKESLKKMRHADELEFKREYIKIAFLLFSSK